MTLAALDAEDDADGEDVEADPAEGRGTDPA
jgi:hypothetical protein